MWALEIQLLLFKYELYERENKQVSGRITLLQRVINGIEQKNPAGDGHAGEMREIGS